MRLVDLQAAGYDSQTYSISAVHNTQQTLLTGIVSNKRPVGVVVLEANFAPGEYLIGYSWDLSSDLAPRVTLQFSANVTRDVQVAVLYQI